MGQCQGKNISVAEDADGVEDGRRHRRKRTPTHPSNGLSSSSATPNAAQGGATPVQNSLGNFWPSPYPPGSATGSPLPAGIAPSPARSTPRRFFRRPFPPPSPAKHIKASLVKRFGTAKPKEGTIVEDVAALAVSPEVERPLDKTFGYGKHFGAKYELGKEVGGGISAIPAQRG